MYSQSKLIEVIKSLSPENPFKDKWVSIFGDHISTFNGWNYGTSDETASYPFDSVNSVNKTWWHLLLSKLEAKLCVNQSENERYVTEIRTNSYFLDKIALLHRNIGCEYINLDGTKETATVRQDPDIILVAVGNNDFDKHPQPIGKPSWETNTADACFAQGYEYLMNIISQNYPNAVIYCLTPTYSDYSKRAPYNGAGCSFSQYVDVVETEAAHYSSPCIHTHCLNIHQHNYADYLMNEDRLPNEKMMKLIAEKCYSDMMEKSAITNTNDILELRDFINSKVGKINYATFEEMENDWHNIPNESVIFIEKSPFGEGYASEYRSVLVIKQSPHRSLCITTNKNEYDYLWVRFQGGGSANDWTNASSWRKIPVLTNSGDIVASNITSMESRISSLETNTRNLLDKFYPVGTIYTSTNNQEPNSIFGGSWTKITSPFSGANSWIRIEP